MFFWNSLAFSMIQRMLAIWSLVPLPFLNPAWTSGSSPFTYCWSLAWRIYSLLELTPKKDVLFIIGDWNAKVGSQEIPGVNRQIWPWSTEWSRAKTNRVLPRKCTGHNKHPLPTTQEKTLHMDITRWATPKSHWFYSLQPKMEKLYTVSKNKTESWLWFRSWTAYCQIQT